MSETNHYGLKRLTNGDDISDDSFKFSDADRVLMDTLMYLGAEGHHHTGGVPGTNAPASAPTLTLDTTQGSIPAGTRVYYVYTYVDSNGIETAPSPSAFIDTPAAVGSPSAPTASYVTTGGTLLPGSYYYVLSAYTDSNNYETLAAYPVYISVAVTTNTNVITLVLPPLPTGADGFNVYRKNPTGSNYHWIAAIDMQVATPPTEFEDDGSYAEDCDRLLPTANTALSTNSITITLPGATPSLPVGYTWRIYRTYVAGTWTNSLLVTETDTSYLDLGAATSVGQPPSTDVGVGTPSKVLLTGAAEVQGVLPVENIADFSVEVDALVADMFVDSSTIDFEAVGGATPTGYITAHVKPIVLATRAVTSYTPILGDAGYVIEMNVASANNFTVPPNSSVAFPVGTVMEVFQYGAGQTTIVAGGGVTLRSVGNKLKLTAQYSAATLRKIATDEWHVAGDLSA